MPALPRLDPNDAEYQQRLETSLKFHLDVFIWAQTLYDGEEQTGSHATVGELADIIMDRIQDIVAQMDWDDSLEPLIDGYGLQEIYRKTDEHSKLREFAKQLAVARSYAEHLQNVQQGSNLNGPIVDKQKLETLSMMGKEIMFDFLEMLQMSDHGAKPCVRSNKTGDIDANFARGGSCHFHNHRPRLECHLQIED